MAAPYILDILKLLEKDDRKTVVAYEACEKELLEEKFKRRWKDSKRCDDDYEGFDEYEFDEYIGDRLDPLAERMNDSRKICLILLDIQESGRITSKSYWEIRDFFEYHYLNTIEYDNADDADDAEDNADDADDTNTNATNHADEADDADDADDTNINATNHANDACATNDVKILKLLSWLKQHQME